MPSVIDICNQALDLLGASTITALTDSTKEARLCNRNFTSVHDQVLELHTWNDAINRAEITADASAPAFGFTYQYTMPTDPYCLRVLSFWNSNVDSEVAAYDSQVMYKIEGRKILSNEGTCKITFIGRTTAIGTGTTELNYDKLLISCIAHALASEIAYAITGSNSIKQQMYQLTQAKISEARSMDAMEGYPEKIIADDFVNIRF